VGRLDGFKRDVVERHDLQGQTLNQISESLGVSHQRAAQIRRDAFKDLRRDRQLRQLLENETPYYHHLGVKGFNTSWTSTTERVALWRIERERAMFDTPGAAQYTPACGVKLEQPSALARLMRRAGNY